MRYTTRFCPRVLVRGPTSALFFKGLQLFIQQPESLLTRLQLEFLFCLDFIFNKIDLFLMHLILQAILHNILIIPHLLEHLLVRELL